MTEVAFPKINPARDKKYLKWITRLPCLGWGRHTGDVVYHHIYSLGTGIKCSDYKTVPVCYDHHQEAERSRREFEEKYHVDLYEEADRLRKEYLDEEY